MGLGGISIWQLIIVFLIIVMLFGTKKLRGIGSDLGGAIKGFKDAVSSNDGKNDAVFLNESTGHEEHGRKNLAIR